MSDFRPSTEECVRSVFDCINGRMIPTEFCELARREHPYLQQEFTKLCLKWLDALNKIDSDSYIDPRISYSKRVADVVMPMLKEKRLY